MNDAILDPFRHNAWATRELLAFCRPLTEEQLAATVPGTYGSILATLHHVIDTEAYYVGLLSGATPSWYREGEDAPPPDVEELERRAGDVEQRWEVLLLGSPLDPAWRIPGGDWEADAGVVVSQALNHGSEHRAQVCTILSALGRQPPALDGWAWGEATGRHQRH